jgi:transposase InsO family protein
LSQPESDSNG